MPVFETNLRPLLDGELIKELNQRYGDVPDELRQSADRLALLIPALRADLAALETFEPSNEAPLPCPISTFGGVQDPAVGAEPSRRLARSNQRSASSPHISWRSFFLGLAEIAYFEPGSRSLLALMVLARVRAVRAVRLSLRDVFEAPTIRQLAERLVAVARLGLGVVDSEFHEREEILV